MSGIDVYVVHLDRLQADERERLVDKLRPGAHDYEFRDDGGVPRLYFDEPPDPTGVGSLMRAEILVKGLSEQLDIDRSIVAVALTPTDR